MFAYDPAEKPEPITDLTWSEVINMRNEYAVHPRRLFVKHPHVPEQTLTGLRIPVQKIFDILAQGDISHIYIMFGVKRDLLGSHIPHEEKYFTTIFTGIKEDPENPTANGILAKEELRDFCEPCPTKCPQE